MYHLTNEILNALDNNLSIGGVFYDLENAFDCVNHKIPLSKLEFYGITDTIISSTNPICQISESSVV
jgi:hypothetical protein